MAIIAGKLDPCFILTYRSPAEELRNLVPSELDLVTHGPWGFWSVFACRVHGFRPAFLPKFMGLNYCHVAYRIHVQSEVKSGKTMRGTFFTRSDVNSFLVSTGGKLSSDLGFHRSKIELSARRDPVDISVRTSDGKGDLKLELRRSAKPGLAAGSCFASEAEAESILHYQPLGLSLSKDRKNLVLMEVERTVSDAPETAYSVVDSQWSYFKSLGLTVPVFEAAREIPATDCRWLMGKTEAL